MEFELFALFAMHSATHCSWHALQPYGNYLGFMNISSPKRLSL